MRTVVLEEKVSKELGGAELVAPNLRDAVLAISFEKKFGNKKKKLRGTVLAIGCCCREKLIKANL